MNLNDTLRPSSAHRWLKCTGSIELTLKLTPEYLASLTNAAAKEGQRLHERAADVLTGKIPLDIISDDDKPLIQPYIDYINQYIDKYIPKRHRLTLHPSQRSISDSEIMSTFGFVSNNTNHRQTAMCTLETRAKKTYSNIEIGGTPDFASWHTNDIGITYVTIADLKTGQIPVDVANNTQLKLYALLFVASFGENQKLPYYINFTIAQAKCEGITEDQITYQSLKKWEQDTLIPVLKQIENQNYTYNLGDHCRYCPARPLCPEQTKQFRAVQSQTKEMLSAANLDHLFWVAEKEKEITDYIKVVKDFLIHGLTNNTIRSNKYALTPKFGHEKWKGTTEEVADWLTHWEVNPFEQKLISPAKARKELKNEEVQNEISKSQTERHCIGYKIENSQKLVNKVFSKIEK